MKSWEGLRLKAYDAGEHDGVLTIGYGHRIQPGENLGREITVEQADALLRADVTRFEKAVKELIQVPLQQHQFDALTSFVFNIGIENFRKSTLRRLLNAKDYQGAAKQFERWIYCGGRELAGLRRRRMKERALFERGYEDGVD